MKKNCCPQIDKIILYRLNLLNSEEHRLIEEHLQTCQKCQQEMKIEDKIESELATSLDPGEIEARVLQKLRFYKNYKFARRQVHLLSWVLNSIFIVALGFSAGIILEIFWNEIFPAFNNILINASKTPMNILSIFFFLSCLFFSFRRRILRVFE